MIFCHSQIEAVGDLTQSLPLPLKGEGRGIAFLGFVGFALLVHSCPTRLQQGLPGVSLVSVPHLVPKNRTQGHTGLSLGLPFFLGAFLLRQGCQISLQLVIHRLLDGADCVKKIPIAHQARLGLYLRGFRVDQSFLFQLPNVLGYCVGAHAGTLADPPDTGPALMRFPVLAENQVGVDRQLARI